MRRNCLRKLAWLITGLAVFLVVSGASAARPKREHQRYPLRCAGIQVGKTTDAQVVRRYGPGLFVDEEGHLGGRYFVDPKRQVTLHVVIGVDRVIDEIEYGRGVRLPAKHRRPGTIPKAAISRNLSSSLQLQTGIRLGDSASLVLRRFGEPAKDTRSGQNHMIQYGADESTMRDVLIYEAEFRLENNRLIAIRLYNGE